MDIQEGQLVYHILHTFQKYDTHMVSCFYTVLHIPGFSHILHQLFHNQHRSLDTVECIFLFYFLIHRIHSLEQVPKINMFSHFETGLELVLDRAQFQVEIKKKISPMK